MVSAHSTNTMQNLLNDTHRDSSDAKDF